MYSTQARRLGHTADRAKRVAALSTTEEQRKELMKQNDLTIQAIFKNFVDKEDEEEGEWQKRLQEAADSNGSALFCTYSRAQQWYNGKASATRGQATQLLIKNH